MWMTNTFLNRYRTICVYVVMLSAVPFIPYSSRQMLVLREDSRNDITSEHCSWWHFSWKQSKSKYRQCKKPLDATSYQGDLPHLVLQFVGKKICLVLMKGAISGNRTHGCSLCVFYIEILFNIYQFRKWKRHRLIDEYSIINKLNSCWTNEQHMSCKFEFFLGIINFAISSCERLRRVTLWWLLIHFHAIFCITFYFNMVQSE